MKYQSIKFMVAMLLTTTVMLFNSGCKKGFLDVNSDPNRVTGENITPELIFPQAANAVGVRQASGNLTFIEHWMGYFASPGDYAPDKPEITYNITSSFSDAIWGNTYDVLFDLNQVKVKAMAKGDSALTGASMILSARLWQDLVDMFGDIPYSQAFNNDQYIQPGYDKGSEVYASLQKSLDTAISYMKATPRGTFKTVDIVNKGNTTKWIKFANTLKLRLLIRQSEIPGFSPGGEPAKIIANGGVLHAGESVTVNPGYTNETNKQSPYYANFGLSPTGTDASATFRANAYIVNILKTNNDPRLNRFFLNPTGGGSAPVGDVYGAASNPIGTASSKPGLGLAGSATQDQWIFPSFESMFLEAEAIARGWLPGSAQTAYQNAVTESFTWLGVPNAATAAATYMANNANANWANAGTTVASQVKFIVYQKYISLTGVDPLEAWCDYRRLRVPSDNGFISQDPSKISTTIPNRLLYPQTEYTTNNANVNAEGTINQFTSKIFWQP
jgi:hypothetical protein